ncbi:MAG: glycosyltransferase family 39 protein [Armatimonadota bacterium]
MPGVAIYLAVTLTAFMLGTCILRLVRLSPDDDAQRGLAALVAGHVLLALLILGLGLLGYLQWWALAQVLLLAVLAGLRVLDDAARSCAEMLGRLRWELTRSPLRVIHWVIIVVIALQLVAALAPPLPTDYDGLAEHLAMAKQWSRDGRIHPLWYDHHSQFPATMQMFYTLAHVFEVPGAAKLFHWGFGVIAIGAAVLIGRRLAAPAAGSWAGLVLATTPGFAWLMGVGYVDLATIACGLLALLFFLRWANERDDWQLWLSAVMAGAGAGTKMQGLALMGLLAVAAIIMLRGRWLRGVGKAAAYVGIALIICGPWYVKSYVWTGNPVYPFAYEIFGGKMWSQQRADGYRYDQRNYGKGDLPPRGEFEQMDPLERAFAGPRRPLNMLLAAFNLTFDPAKFTVPLSTLGVWATDSIGPLWLALLPLLLLFRRPPSVSRMMWLLLPLWLWWLWSMQLTRYLLPSLALVAPAAGWAVVEAERHSKLLNTIVRSALAVWTVIALGLMLVYVLPQAPAAFGQVDEHDYLAQTSLYAAASAINRTAPASAKVALYAEPRGYYLDRDYLWAEPGHSALIHYERVESAEDLVGEWQRLGVTHVMINLALFPDLHDSEDRLARTIGDAIEQGLLEPMDMPGSARPYAAFRLVAD